MAGITETKAKFAKEMTYYDDVPKELISPSELLQETEKMREKEVQQLL